MQLPSGRKLASYEIAGPLGAGGMGEVYRARDQRLDRDVAIKVLPEGFADDPERLVRFEREAKALAALNHPNIATVHGFEQDGDTHFLVMELVEGEDLAERLARGPIPVDEAIPLFLQIAEGLEAAHERGIVHRDLKPANIKIADDGRVKILDFGLAKTMEPTPLEDADLSQSPTMTAAATMRGEILGTAAYMSPEQARGLPVDKRTDVWAFGACLYEALTGKRLFRGEDASLTLAAVLAQEPELKALPDTVGAPLRRILGRCLRKDPRERTRDIGDVRLALEDATLEEDDEPSRGALPRTRSVVAALVATALLAALAGWWLRGDGRPPEPPRPITRFTLPLEPGSEIIDAPAISRDGSTIAYVALDAEGRSALWARRLDDVEPRKLTEEVATIAFPFVSPRGNWVAYFSRDGLMKISTNGGAPIRIGENRGPQGGTWLDEETLVAVPYWAGGLQLIDAETGATETLTTPSASHHAHAWPTVLPHGQEVLFTTWGAPTQGAILSLSTLEWSAVSGVEYTAVYAASGHVLNVDVPGEVRAGIFEPGSRTAGSADRTVLTGVAEDWSGRQKWMGFSDNGTLVYAPGDFARRRLVWVDRDGTNVPLLEEERPYSNVALSPDGNQVAIQVLDTVEVLDLTRNSRPVKLPGGEGSPRAEERQIRPSWSLDGTKVYYHSMLGAKMNMHEVLANASRPPETRAFRVFSRVELTPEGRMVYGTDVDGMDIAMTDLDGAEIRLVATPGSDENPSLSPDGRFFTYSSNFEGQTQVYARAIPETGYGKPVSINGGRWPRWSPAGGEIFFVSGQSLMTAPVNTVDRTLVIGEPKPLFEVDLAPGHGFNTPYDVTADGQRFLTIQRRPDMRPDRLHVVLNWFQELERMVSRD